MPGDEAVAGGVRGGPLCERELPGERARGDGVLPRAQRFRALGSAGERDGVAARVGEAARRKPPQARQGSNRAPR